VAAEWALYGIKTENLSQYSLIIATKRHGTIVSPPDEYRNKSMFSVLPIARKCLLIIGTMSMAILADGVPGAPCRSLVK